VTGTRHRRRVSVLCPIGRSQMVLYRGVSARTMTPDPAPIDGLLWGFVWSADNAETAASIHGS